MSMYPGYTLHQTSPYIGRIRPSLARHLILKYSKEGDWVWDPFCGSGTIPLECRLLSRHVIAADVNPYACALSRAKLHAPVSQDVCRAQLNSAAKELQRPPRANLSEAPQWVKSFFHECTLRETRTLMSEFIRKRQYFNAGCLLGILHHQRPGFLSYPASHLVPYLRERLYPRDLFPEAYEYRNPIPRLLAKIERVLKYPPPPVTSRFRVLQESALLKYLPNRCMDAVITSPPYMDALEYARDNRLRLWFLDTNDYKTIKQKEIRRISTFQSEMMTSLRIMSQALRPGGACVLILGDVISGNRNYDLSEMISSLVTAQIGELCFESKLTEDIPDQRRTRRNGRATKKETILAFRRS